MKKEIISAGLILLILGAFATSETLVMPMELVSLLTLGILLAFMAFATFVLSEHARDEREVKNQNKAGRISFLVGASVLLTGIVVQVFNHNIDPWLIWGFGLMVLTKLLTLIYAHFKM